MISISELKVKLFADGADKAQMQRALANPLIGGFTTNPTLMRTAGVKDYEALHMKFWKLSGIGRSLSRFSPIEFPEMERQATESPVGRRMSTSRFQ